MFGKRGRYRVLRSYSLSRIIEQSGSVYSSIVDWQCKRVKLLGCSKYLDIAWVVAGSHATAEFYNSNSCSFVGWIFAVSRVDRVDSLYSLQASRFFAPEPSRRGDSAGDPLVCGNGQAGPVCGRSLFWGALRSNWADLISPVVALSWWPETNAAGSVPHSAILQAARIRRRWRLWSHIFHIFALI